MERMMNSMKKQKKVRPKVPIRTRFYYLTLTIFGVILTYLIGLPMVLLVIALALVLKFMRWLEIY